MAKRVLFVCLGNICRSPAAEAVLTHLAAQRGVAVEVASAGIIGMHAGKPPDRRMRSSGEARGYNFRSRARQVTAADLAPGAFDLVIAMDRHNLADLRRLTDQPMSHVVPFGQFLDETPPPDVPDPYYGGPEGFQQVLDMLERGCPRILDALIQPL